ncbi:MAG: hypothetical protein IJ058_01870 [Lachnospiraceae bacterium]|nr:hypothetical protein [Lachnospiraceae bacterium]
MKIAVITIAGVSSRFNEGVPEEEKRHKIIYYEGNREDTLLYHLLEKCGSFDHIVLVGGNRYDEVQDYCDKLPGDMKTRIELVYNEHYADLASGYSLYVGLKAIFETYENDSIEEILFVEGDLDIDRDSFDTVVSCKSDVLTYNYEPIYSNKAVVLYRDGTGSYRYAFNSSHGLLRIDEPFSMILNSGQMWKFTDIEKLKVANDIFYSDNKSGTNLCIIQEYIDQQRDDDPRIIGLKRWTNCNTREDYRRILTYWNYDRSADISES